VPPLLLHCYYYNYYTDSPRPSQVPVESLPAATATVAALKRALDLGGKHVRLIGPKGVLSDDDASLASLGVTDGAALEGVVSQTRPAVDLLGAFFSSPGPKTAVVASGGRA